MANLELIHVSKGFEAERKEVTAVRELNLTIPSGVFFTLLGPSGCGKTTSLRCIAGLERPDKGEILLDNVILSSSQKNLFVPTKDRKIGMVFQSYAIWPHMSVFENIAFPLKVAKLSAQAIKERVKSAVELVELEGLENRPTPQLSGGQQQRVALARALVRDPELLLLDEPLSNLDASLREHMRLELRRLQKRTGITSIYVTHDQLEALSISDHIAVMNRGELVALGTPEDIYNNPQDEFSAKFIGNANLIPGRLIEKNSKEMMDIVETDIGSFSCTTHGIKEGEEVMLTAKAEDFELVQRSGKSTNIFQGKIDNRMFTGASYHTQVQVGSFVFTAMIPKHYKVDIGDSITLYIDPSRIRAISRNQLAT